MILLDEATARDVIDALRLLNGRLLGERRTLSPGAIQLRSVAERSLRASTDRPRPPLPATADDGETQQLVDTPTAARMLNVSVTTMKRMRANEELPFVKIGRTVRFALDDIAAFIADRTENQ